MREFNGGSSWSLSSVGSLLCQVVGTDLCYVVSSFSLGPSQQMCHRSGVMD